MSAAMVSTNSWNTRNAGNKGGYSRLDGERREDNDDDPGLNS